MFTRRKISEVLFDKKKKNIFSGFYNVCGALSEPIAKKCTFELLLSNLIQTNLIHINFEIKKIEINKLEIRNETSSCL